MTFHFFDHNGHRLFSRSDAIEFEHYVDTMSYKGVFPCTGHIPQACMMVGWIDDDDLWEVHEVSTVQMDAFGENFEISGNHIGVTELGAFIAPKCKLKSVSAIVAIQRILAYQSSWQLGTVPAVASDDPLRKQNYRVNKKVTMYAQQSTSSKKLSTYKKNKYLTPVAQPSSSWWQMEGPDGRIGWINNPLSYMSRFGDAGDEDRIVTFDEKFVPLWELLSKVQEECGWIIVPRVTISDSGITGRYIDVRTDNPDYHGVRLTCHTNITEGFIKYDVSHLYTAMYGVGKNDKDFGSVVWTIAGGFPVNKPKNQTYVALDDALAIYGHNGVHRFGVCNIADEDDASELLSKTYDTLVASSVPEITIDGTIADLYKLGYGGESMRLFDKVQVILEPIGRRTELRITGLTRDLVQPERTQPTIGAMDNLDMVKTVVSASGGATSIKSWQISSGAVGTEALADSSISSEKIIAGAVVAEAISADAVVSEKIAAGAVTAEKIGAGSVTADKVSANAITSEKIGAGAITTEKLAADAVESNNIAAGAVKAEHVETGELDTKIASVGFGKIQDGVAEQFITRDGTADRYMIRKLQVTNLQVVEQTVGNLVLKASDGNYYRLDIADGIVSPTQITVTDDEIAAGVTSDGRRSIIETDLTVADLSATSVKAINALIDKITAGRIDADELFARDAVIGKLRTTRIIGDRTLEIIVDDFDNLAIGGRNYIRNSRALLDAELIQTGGVYQIADQLHIISGVTVVKSSSTLHIS